jgi:hypothetical protein
MHARHKLDCGVLSEPIMLLNLLYIYRTSANKHELCNTYGLAHIRMRQINNSYTHLLDRICDVMRSEKGSKNFRGGKGKGKGKGKGSYSQSGSNGRDSMGGTPEELDIANTDLGSLQQQQQGKFNKSPSPKKRGGMKNRTPNHGNEEEEETGGYVHRGPIDEELYLKTLGSAKIHVLRILLTWIFHDQVFKNI